MLVHERINRILIQVRIQNNGLRSFMVAKIDVSFEVIHKQWIKEKWTDCA